MRFHQYLLYWRPCNLAQVACFWFLRCEACNSWAIAEGGSRNIVAFADGAIRILTRLSQFVLLLATLPSIAPPFIECQIQHLFAWLFLNIASFNVTNWYISLEQRIYCYGMRWDGNRRWRIQMFILLILNRTVQDEDWLPAGVADHQVAWKYRVNEKYWGLQFLNLCIWQIRNG